VLGDYPQLLAALREKIDPRALHSIGEGRIAWDEATDLEPVTHWMLVVRAREKDTSAGGLVIPESHREAMCAGWVLAAGPLVGSDIGSRPPGALHLGPEQVIGKAILFGLHSLASILISERDGFYNSAFGFLTDFDVKCIDRSRSLF
jgi:co-chaperonin GroES (HSP10)